MKRDEDLARLRSEMKQIGDVCPRTGKTRGIYKIVEMAAARCGLYPSYAYGLILGEERASVGFRKAPTPVAELYRSARRMNGTAS